MRNITVWFFGTFGCAVMGALIGEMISPATGAVPGALIGFGLFVCVRVFMPAPSGKQSL